MNNKNKNIDSVISQILKEEINKKSDEMNEKLHGGQHKLDVAKPKGVLNKKDFEKLSSMKKENIEEIEQDEVEEQETEEGNAFSGALAKAKKDGKDSFEVDGKKYDVKESVKKHETKEEEKWIQKTDMKKGALRKKLGVPEGKKIPKSKLNSLKKELMSKGKGEKKLSDSDSKLLKQVNLALTLGDVKENVETKKLRFTENELVDFIEKIILEQEMKEVQKVKDNIKVQTPVGLAEVEKANKKTEKDNTAEVKAVTKKLKEYLKDGSKEDFTMEPKHFPKGNGELGEMKKKAYKASDAVEEYIQNLAYPGMENLDYDEIKPNDEWLTKNLEGSSETGNNPKWANSVETDLGKKVNEKRKKNLYSNEKKRSYNRVTQPVDEAGEGEGSKELDSMFAKLESTEEKKDKVIKEDITKMFKLMGYKEKTQ